MFLKPCGWTALSEKSISMDTTFNIGYTGRNAYDRAGSWISLNNILSPWPNTIHSKLHSSNKQENVVQCTVQYMQYVNCIACATCTSKKIE
jgi:hypothetical protein